jgi:hypothetical protein
MERDTVIAAWSNAFIFFSTSQLKKGERKGSHIAHLD